MSRTETRKPTTFNRLVLRLSLRNTLIPVLLFVSVFLLGYNLYTQHVLVRRNARICEAAAQELQTLCSSYTEYLQDLTASEKIDAVLSGSAGSEELFADFYRFLNTQDYRGTFYLLDGGKNLRLTLDSIVSDASINSVKRLALRVEQAGGVLASEKTFIAISYISSERSRAYTVVAPVRRDEEVKGFLAYRFYEKGLTDLIRGEGAQLFVLTDHNGGIIASGVDASADALDRFVPEMTSSGKCRLGGENYYIARRGVWGTGLELYTLSRHITFFGPDEMLLTAFILLMVAVSYITYSRSLTRKITEPVDQLLEAIQQLKTGDFTPTESLTNLEEFRQIFDEYNGAIEQLDQLMETQQSLKLHQLEAQFNPHFLYNVLETLKYTIATDTEAAQDIVLRLSHLMRYAATPAEKEVTLGEDLLYIEDYLALQKQRFLDRLSYRIDAQEQAKDAKIFRLLLQPLVENATKYGYVKHQKIEVGVDCRLDGSDLVMTVTDNGGGMEPERLAQVQRTLDARVNESESLGLYNTHHMIRLKYGAAYGLTLYNREGEGLTVVVRMPYKR